MSPSVRNLAGGLLRHTLQLGARLVRMGAAPHLSSRPAGATELSYASSSGSTCAPCFVSCLFVGCPVVVSLGNCEKTFTQVVVLLSDPSIFLLATLPNWDLRHRNHSTFLTPPWHQQHLPRQSRFSRYLSETGISCLCEIRTLLIDGLNCH